MVFSTPLFLFVYLSLTLLLYYAVPLKGRNLALLAVSLFFYAWGERIYVVIMVASTLIDYTHGMLVERCKAGATTEAPLGGGVVGVFQPGAAGLF